MRIYFKGIVVALVVAMVAVVSPTQVKSYTDVLTYCSKGSEKTGCEDRFYTLEYFLKDVGDQGGFYPAINFKIVGDYLYFEDQYFEYYIALPLVELELLTKVDLGSFVDSFDWQQIDSNRNLVPDFADEIAADFNFVHKAYFGSEGSKYLFKKAWTGRLPVIITYGEDGVLGYFAHGNDSDWRSGGKFMSVDPRVFGVEMRSLIAHELFHTIQYSYIGDSMGTGHYDSFIEGMAVAVQKIIVPNSKLPLGYLPYTPDLQPEKPIFGTTERGDFANYGSFIWYEFLTFKYPGSKDQPSIIYEILEEYAKISATDSNYRSYVAIENALKRHGTSLLEAFNDYTVWNYDKRRYENRVNFNDVKVIKTHSQFPTGNVTIGTDLAPHYFASNYIEFDSRKTSAPYLKFDFWGNKDADIQITLLPVKDGNTKKIKYVDEKNIQRFTVPKGGSAHFNIRKDSQYTKYTMVVSVVSINGHDEDIFKTYVYPYSYSVDGSWNVPTGEDVQIFQPIESTPAFTDVSVSHKNNKAITYLKENSIISGYSDGTYKPDQTVNRAELLVILLRGKNLTLDSTKYKNCFKDVAAEWFATAVCYAKEQGWVNGYGDGTFKPDQTVNKAEALKMLLNSQNVTVPSSVTVTPFEDVALNVWYTPFITKAKELNILEETGNLMLPDTKMTRGSTAENLYRLLIKN